MLPNVLLHIWVSQLQGLGKYLIFTHCTFVLVYICPKTWLKHHIQNARMKLN